MKGVVPGRRVERRVWVEETGSKGEHRVDRRLVGIVLVVLLVAGAVGLAAQDQPLPSSMTLRSVAHGVGVRGSELAEALGMPRQTDKEKPLAELGVTPTQLRAALDKLGVEPGEITQDQTGEPLFSTDMTLRQVADALKIPPNALAHDMRLDLDALDPDVPLVLLGVDAAMLDRVVAHNLEEHEEGRRSWLKYPIYAAVSLFALMYLLRWGIPRSADPKKRKRYYPRWIFIAVLVLSVAVLGFALGKSPNPMESAVKVFKATVGLYGAVGPKLAALVFFLALGVAANKVVCGWACPFGALEELIYMLPLFKKAKRRTLPFWISNAIRAALFVLFLLMIYGIVAAKGTVLYHPLNPFNLFNFDFSTAAVPVFLAVYLLAAFFFYRPFCRFICPFGLFSWLTERFSLARIRIDFERCIDCGSCKKTCPLSAAGDRLEKKSLPADCFSCMRCLRVCPEDAIHYRPAWGSPSPKDHANTPG